MIIKNKIVSKIIPNLFLYCFTGLIPLISTVSRENSLALEKLSSSILKSNKPEIGSMKIKFQDLATNNKHEVTIFELMCGTLAAEMPVWFHEEALKAQVVAAFTYFLKNGGMEGPIPLNSEKGKSIRKFCYISAEDRKKTWEMQKEGMSAAWEQKIQNAVKAVLGQIITYHDELIDAFFSANCYKKTTPGGIGFDTDVPYLVSVETHEFDDKSNNLSPITKTLTKLEVEDILKEKYKDYEKIKDNLSKLEPEEWFKITNKLDHGYVCNLKILDQEIKGKDFRTLIGLRSSNFTIEYNKSKNEFKFTAWGYGHGVGMSQFGAHQMAKEGKTYDQILKHYYKEVELQQWQPQQIPIQANSQPLC